MGRGGSGMDSEVLDSPPGAVNALGFDSASWGDHSVPTSHGEPNPKMGAAAGTWHSMCVKSIFAALINKGNKCPPNGWCCPTPTQ